MIFKLLLLAVCCTVSAHEVELFLYWIKDPKGHDSYPVMEETSYEHLPTYSRIRRRLREKGSDLKRWEIEAHKDQLLNWKGVHSFGDLWRWLFPRPIDDDAIWVFASLGAKTKELDFKRAPHKKKMLILYEPPVVEPRGYESAFLAEFERVLTWDDDLVDNRKFFKFYYPVYRQRIAAIPSFEEKKFCVMMNTRLSSKHTHSLYREREKTIRFFEEKPGEFDLYGRNWEKRKYKNWKGPVDDKLSTIQNYKFCICYENMRDVKGYITEKIFDCFAAGTVPVYWGASNVTDWIPANCFIDRRQFSDEQALYDHLKSIGAQEYDGYVERAATFLQSETAQLFSDEHYVQTFVRNVMQMQ